MKKIFLAFTFIASFFVGCTDLKDEVLDRIPEDQYVVDPVLQMTPIYEPMREFLDNGGWWFAQELTSDEMVGPTRASDWDDGGKWRVLHTHTWENNTEAINNMWERFNRGVTEANKFLEAQAQFAGDSVVDAGIAKGKILRAYYYYLLIDNYGDVPFVTEYLNAPKLPVKEHRDVIWQNIVNDIETGIEKLPPSTSKTAVTPAMAYALLAKLYLNAEQYTGTSNPDYWVKAEQACDAIIALGQYSLEANPLAPFVTNNQNSVENIWAIPYDEDNYKGNNLHMRTLHYNSNLTFDMSVGPWNGFAVTEDHYNTYTENDLRKAYFLVGQQYTSDGKPITDAVANANLVFTPNIPALLMDASFTAAQIRMSGARVAKFEIKKGAKDNLSNDFPIFRYADVLLMKAEAMIRQGKNGDEFVNMVRVRAGLEPWSGTTLDQILEERGREMFWEAHRRQDLIRFGKFNDEWWEKPASTPDRKIFPIPQWAIDANPNLGDNI
ncbi:MAG: RagB/SusD family nutrient uptake outer membrane protein [Chloroflexota bacterium]|nr:RagB/SusD family nutrient uptake outer membrane protein [Lentimicrobium sp.]